MTDRVSTYAERLKGALKKKADANGDGKLDKKDIELIVNRMDALVQTEGDRKPWGLLVAGCVGGAVVASAVWAVLC
jgi:hypothetical protein